MRRREMSMQLRGAMPVAASVGLLVAMAGCGDPAVEDNEPQDPQPPLNEDAEEGPANGDGAPDTAASGSFQDPEDRKSTRLNSSHVAISYAVFCLNKKKHTTLSHGTPYV